MASVQANAKLAPNIVRTLPRQTTGITQQITLPKLANHIANFPNLIIPGINQYKWKQRFSLRTNQERLYIKTLFRLVKAAQ